MAPYFERKISNYELIYYKLSKNILNVVCGKISSFKLTLLRFRGFKLAQFFNQNLEKLYISEIVQYLYGYTTYREKKFEEANKIFPDGFPLVILIKKFQAKYILYLLFDTLRYLKYLELQDRRHKLEKDL